MDIYGHNVWRITDITSHVTDVNVTNIPTIETILQCLWVKNAFLRKLWNWGRYNPGRPVGLRWAEIGDQRDQQEQQRYNYRQHVKGHVLL